jgi:hypothetical protein
MMYDGLGYFALLTGLFFMLVLRVTVLLNLTVSDKYFQLDPASNGRGYPGKPSFKA